MKILNSLSFVALFAGLLLISGCVTENVDDPYGYNYTAEKKSNNNNGVYDEDKPPNSYVQAQVYNSADTLIVPNGTILKLAGITSPQLGEPYYEKSIEFTKYLVGLKFLRLVWVKGTKRADKVWKVNVIVKHQDYVVSLNEQLVKNGYAKVTVAEPIQYETINLDNEEKLTTLSDEDNKKIYNRLKSLEKEAQKKKLNIWSGKYEK